MDQAPSVVMVVWRDAQSQDQWGTVDEHVVDAPTIVSVGHLIDNDKNAVTIALSIDLVNEHLSQSLIIPKPLIESMEFLEASSKKKGAVAFSSILN